MGVNRFMKIVIQQVV
jgi:hypothetical protein